MADGFNLSTEEIAQISEWMREAGRLALRSQQSLTFEIKDDLSPVTNVEYQIEDFFRKRITSTYPTHALLTEEAGLRTTMQETLWALDPVDGTRSYISRLPIWGISLGILHQSKPVAGFFYMPVVDEMYVGLPSGAYYNGQLLPQGQPAKYSSSTSFLAVSSNAHLYFAFDYPQVRSLGSAAAHYCYLARGMAVGMLAKNLYLWDIAGVLPIMNALGYKLEYLSGRNFDPNDLLTGKGISEPLLAAHPVNFDRLKATIHPK
jgi:myo-inositol-1(or 4)-monophosphatase